jgi:hypothetical protein
MAAYTTTTLADLQTLMIQRWDQVVFWTPEEARLALNEALRLWNLLTGRWRTSVTLNINQVVSGLTPGVPPFSDVMLPGVLSYAMRVTTASGAPLHPTSITELDLARPQWSLETTASGGDVPTQPTLWAPTSLTQINIWPTLPGPAMTPAALLCDGVLRTPILIAPTDTVNLGEEILDVVADFALHVAALKEAGDRWRATRPYFEAFLQAAADENGMLKRNQKYRRWAGLDFRRNLQPTKDAPNQLQGVATQFSSHETEEA